MPRVECDIENCKHNRDGECTADTISLWADHICDGGCDQGWVMTEGSEDTADAVEVVRCKDCIHGIPTRIDTETWTVSYERYCNRHRMVHFGDYYCADGKRKENTMKCKDCKNYEYWFGDNYRCADSGTMVSEDDTCPYWRGKEGGAE